MKHQYFGDINDFHKYGLLQLLCGRGKLRIGVCWMLTPDDGRSDGSRTGYLEAPKRWRAYNPDLFDLLRARVKVSGVRDLSSIESRGLPPGAQFYSEVLSDSIDQRQRYFIEMQRTFAKADLIFFDPDNGLEVESVPLGVRNSSKYLYWREVSEVYKAKHSVLIYQHFRREQRSRFVVTLAMLCSSTGAVEVYSFRTAHVVFFLAARKEHRAYFRHVAAQVKEIWVGQFEVFLHRSEESIP